MDRNSIIGFVLLLLLGTGYIFWNNHEQKQYLEQRTADSLAKAATRPAMLPEEELATLSADTLTHTDSSRAPLVQQESFVDLNNTELSLQFTTKGGYPVEARLDSFTTYGGSELLFFKGKKNELDFTIPVNGQMVRTASLHFSPELKELADGGKQLTMTAEPAPGKKVVLTYALPASGYMLSANLRLVGFHQELSSQKTIPLHWTTEVLRSEKDLKNERMYMQVHYLFKDGSHDYFTLSRKPERGEEDPMKWFSVRSHFFNSTLIADDAFADVAFSASEPHDTSGVVALNTTEMVIPTSASNDFSFGFSWFIGPNDYHLLKSYKLDLEEMISLGFGPFFFVKYISKWMIIPLFDFLGGIVANYGIVIILMTLVIRLLLSFFSYKSYLSSAKMRVLKPELDELRAKFGDNQQQMGMEQMKLYRTAGVNPLGGCLPMLLQMPFLLAMYYFIPTAIELRNSSFLWAEDLSSYDSVLNLGFNIPFYGDHVSLFTLLMAITSLFLALYNRNMTGAPAGGNNDMMKMMKWMPYVMPFMFLGWFNGMAAGLTFYYTFSNLVSIAQQFIIQKFIINEEAIHQKIQKNKNRPAGTSKWQQKLEQMQKMQAERLKQQKQR